jgi:hypothetical protein
MPEHVVFALGFTVLAALLCVVVLLARRSLHVIAHSCGVTPTPLLHNGAAVLGFLAIPFLCLMAWIPDSASPVHFISALIMFGVLALYQLLITGVATAVLYRTPAWPWPMLLLPLYFLLCAVGALASAFCWVTQQNNVFEYSAVALEFCFFIGAAPLFDMAVRRLDERSAQGAALLASNKPQPV